MINNCIISIYLFFSSLKANQHVKLNIFTTRTHLCFCSFDNLATVIAHLLPFPLLAPTTSSSLVFLTHLLACKVIGTTFLPHTRTSSTRNDWHANVNVSHCSSSRSSRESDRRADARDGGTGWTVG